MTEKTAELEKLKENDPQAIADLEKELKLVTEAATRWTDNVFACQEVRAMCVCVQSAVAFLTGVCLLTLFFV